VAAVALFPRMAANAAFWNLLLMVTIVLVTWTVAIASPGPRRLLLVLSTVAAMLTIVEVAVRELLEPEAFVPWRLSEAERRRDIGYGAVPGRTNHSKRMLRDRTLYEVDYGIDKNGLRVTPPAKPGTEVTLLCFGCSFMFGEGVADHEALPYLVASRTSGRVKSYNFALHGYGPNHMLAWLEGGRVPRIVDPRGRVVALYLAIPHHVQRAAGVSLWAKSPRYRLEAGRAVRDGMYSLPVHPLAGYGLLRKSAIARRLVRRPPRPPASPALFLAIVDAARHRFEALYPDGAFHALFWPEAGSGPLAAALRERGLSARVLRLPDGDYIIEGDGHPNAAGHDAAATFVLREVLGLD